MKRFISTLLAALFISSAAAPINVKALNNIGPYKLPPLPYSYDALEPFIDTQTMTIHHQKHHASYVDKLNETLAKYPELKGKPIENLLSNLDKVPQEIREAVKNYGGGHYNHSLFWSYMGKDKAKEPKDKLRQHINRSFGSFEGFKITFKEVAINHFGSGWTWLIGDKNGNLKVISTANQENPISYGYKPILGLDLWEHSYYLKYQNKKADYIDAWWNVVNWEDVEKNYQL